MTKENLERLLVDYGVSFTSALADRLLQEFNSEICEDAISRQAAIFLTDELKHDLPDDERLSDMVMARNEGILEYQSQISLLPSVNPQEPKWGHWKQISPARIYECDICGQNVMTGDISAYRYCHGCGAKMVKP